METDDNVITLEGGITVQILKTPQVRAAYTTKSATTEQEPWVNCVMLTRYPKRKAMLQDAICGFVTQDYEHKILTIVNDGRYSFVNCLTLGSEFCTFSSDFNGAGVILNLNKACSIGFKRTLAAKLVAPSDFIVTMDDDGNKRSYSIQILH